jgi:molybdopterin molybdotransferase
MMPAIHFDKALSTILYLLHPLPMESVALADALGIVTATRIVAEEDAVPYPRPAMDGYAVRASECVLATLDHPIELCGRGHSS